LAEKNLRLRDWMEPAHPGIIKQYEDLLSIYQVIKEKYQKAIDNAFDNVSRKIGFVVTTTIPIAIEINEKGTVTNLVIGGDNMRGTLFESELQNALSKIKESPIKASAGKYCLYAIWFDALKLKLKTEWMEPAHFKKPTLTTPVLNAAIHGSTIAVRPEVMEPAHWFDPQVILQPEEAILISVMDEVYPELNLASRISAIREKIRVVRPEVMEPAHFRLSEQLKDNPAELLKAVKELLEKYS
jgi:uncharacterized protein YfkK (UPF0435 family)